MVDVKIGEIQDELEEQRGVHGGEKPHDDEDEAAEDVEEAISSPSIGRAGGGRIHQPAGGSEVGGEHVSGAPG